MEMSEDNDDVGFVFYERKSAFYGIDWTNYVPGPGQFRGGEVALEIRQENADDCDAQVAHLLNDKTFAGEECACVVLNVGRDEGELRDLDKGENLLPAVIEFVIADSGDIDSHAVGDFENGDAAIHGGDGSALDEVARIEVNTGFAVFTLIPYDAGYVGEATETAVIGLQVRMQIVGMKNSKR